MRIPVIYATIILLLNNCIVRKNKSFIYNKTFTMRILALCATIILTILFSAFAAAVMTYTSLAVPIGPWIEPTLALIGMLLVQLLFSYFIASEKQSILTIATIAGGISGIVASACAWSIPTIHFLEPALFQEWLRTPWYFIGAIGVLILSAGALGLMMAHKYEHILLPDVAYTFPMAQLVYKMIAVQNQMRKMYELLVGLIGSFIFSCMHFFMHIIPDKFVLIKAQELLWFCVPNIVMRLDVVPMLWAIGFITGHVLAVPFAVGAFAKLLIIDPCHKIFFSALKSDSFLLAFCAGMIVQGTIMSFISFPKMLMTTLEKWRAGGTLHQVIQEKCSIIRLSLIEVFLGCVTFGIVSYYLRVSFLGMAFVLAGSAICAYQLMLFMGKVGLAPLGRFATFVMVPGMIIFGFTAVQAAVVAAFVEISGGVAADALSGKKIAQLARMEQKTVSMFQWLSLSVCSLCVGGAFWLLITHFGIGSAELIAQKAQSRALLINAYGFDIAAMGFGVLFGFLLKKLRVNASLVLGGLLMPLDWSLILIASGLSTYLVKDKEAQYPFWSGVFAASSLWMLLKTLF